MLKVIEGHRGKQVTIVRLEFTVVGLFFEFLFLCV